MNTFKLNIVNSLVVTGLVAASMMMPILAAELAQAPTSAHQAPVAAPTAGANTIR
ncbi:MAG: hypothetical protein WBL23_03565 [Salinisphaera sp.]|uniref:hypothetical protein n=1 Tax=Salinisphaera sp. TaxID=1914330 RepID=UPI003C7A5326